MKGKPFKMASGKVKPWAFMDRFEIPQLDNPELNYLVRWRLIQTPYGSIYLHRFEGPDSRPTLHDHPWSFISFIFGGYIEQRLNTITRKKETKHRRFINIMRRDDAHYIESLDKPIVWSLLLIGKRRRTWGYWRQFGDTGEWTWTEFDQDFHAIEFDNAMKRRIV